MQISYLSSRRYQRLFASELIVFFSIVICVGLGWFYLTDKYSKKNSPVGVLSIVPAELKLSSNDDSDQQREVTCRLINRSSVSYRIKNVATSCVCTLTEPLSVSEVRPGSEVVLRLRASIPKHGTKEVMVRVETIPALEQMPSLRLVLSGQERQLPYIESLPLPLRLTGNVGGEWVAHKYDLVTVEAAGSPAWIDNIHGTKETIKAVLNIPPTETEFVPGSVKRTYQIDVSGLVPHSVEQVHSSNLVINTSTQFSTSLIEPFVINTMVSLTPLVRVVPKEVSLHVSRVERWPVVRNIMLIGPRADKLKCEMQSPPPSWVSVEVPKATDSEKPILLRLVIQNPSVLGNKVSAPIQLRLTGADKDPVLIDIPVSIIPD